MTKLHNLKKFILLGLMFSLGHASEECQITTPKINEVKTETISKFLDVPQCDTFSEPVTIEGEYTSRRYIKSITVKTNNDTHNKEIVPVTDALIDGKRILLSVCYDKSNNSIQVKFEKVLSKTIEAPVVNVDVNVADDKNNNNMNKREVLNDNI